MAKLQGIRRIESDGVPKELRDTFDTIGISFNTFAEEVFNAFDGNITFDNLNQSVIQLDVTVDANGIPTDSTTIRYLVNGLQGVQVIRAQNLDDDTVVTGQPFISYSLTQNGGFKVSHIAGLPANKKFRLNVLVIGN
jgi:hypothetical protein